MSIEQRIRKTSESLRQRGVTFAVLDNAQTDALFQRVAEVFVDPEGQDAFRGELRRSRRRGVPIAYERYLQGKLEQEVDTSQLFRWVCGNGTVDRICRLDYYAAAPAIELVCSTLDSNIETSWPGFFVEIDVRRALLVTVDRFRLRYAR
jgi:hypothetical protein